MSDNVNHPSHYTDGKYETIDFIERNRFDYHDGNAIKYISRAGKKNPDKMIEDLEKALWYINRAGHKLDCDNHAITVHDYILDKKLSPALASVISLIEVSQYEEAYEMLKAEIERLKKEEKGHEKFSAKPHEFFKTPYFGKVVCVISSDKNLLTPGKVYQVYADRIMANNRDMIMFDEPVYCAEQLDRQFNGLHGKDKPLASFVEFKGEA